MRFAAVALPVVFLLASCASGGTATQGAGSVPAEHLPALDAIPTPAPLALPPVLLVHGINGSSADFDAMKQRFVADGWPADRVFTIDFTDPSWGCNVDNASQLQARVASILQETGAPSLQIVAHSMGNLSSRFFLKNLGGTSEVTTYVSLGGMHHGLASSCSPDFPGKPCVWSELCQSGEYIAQLNAAPATPGNLWWVSIFGTADTTVPNASSTLDGAENIAIEGVDHVGLLQDAATFEQVKRVLRYPPHG